MGLLLFKAALFYLPFRIWTALEGGLMRQFGTDGSTKVMLSSEVKYEEGVVREVVVEKFVQYFKSIHHHNSWYFAYYSACQ